MTWRERLAVLGGLGLLLVIAYIIGMAVSPQKTLELTTLVPASFFAVGKFLPLWGISGKSNFGPYELGLVIWIMDTCNVILIVYGLEGIYRLRPLKRWLDKVQANAGLVLTAYPAFRKAAVIGVVLFVLFPVAGTGAVGATFVGVLLGMHRVILIAAVSLGGCLGGMTMAFIAVNFGNALTRLQEVQQHPVIKYLILAGLALVLAAAVWVLNRAYRRALEGAGLAAEPKNE